MRHVYPVALAALAAGCSSTPQSENVDSPEVVIHAPPSASADAVTSALPRKELPSALAGWRLPAKQGPALGADCAGKSQSSPSPSAAPSCGTNGRVSLEAQALKTRPGEAPPCKLADLAEEGKFSANAASACIDGDYLFISTICMVCRMPDVGAAALARMSELTPGQHKHLAQMVGLSDDKVPSSAEGWRRVVKKR